MLCVCHDMRVYINACLLSYCRPSGTEDVVRVYAEAETKVRRLKLMYVYTQAETVLCFSYRRKQLTDWQWKWLIRCTNWLEVLGTLLVCRNVAFIQVASIIIILYMTV